MQDTIITTDLTPSEVLEIQGGTDSCADFARDVGTFIGHALQLFKAFGDGASGFDWTQK
jgi:hypothetical protein